MNSTSPDCELQDDTPLGYDQVQAARQSVLDQLGSPPPDAPIRPRIGLILGSGLGALHERIKNKATLPYSQITHMPSPSVLGHDGQLILGELGAAEVACLSGRIHLYEGHGPEKVVFGVRLLAALGVDTLIVTNAAGGIGESCSPGSFMLISDHINFTSKNPLAGPNDDRFGPRFPDMSRAYDPALRALASELGLSQGLTLSHGVYAGVLGPSYETPAEIAMFRNWGASAVGMSTVLEVIAARHLKLRVLGVSCITNYAAGRAPGELNHKDVAREAENSAAAFCTWIESICSRIVEERDS